jgi:hypothetical protein
MSWVGHMAREKCIQGFGRKTSLKEAAWIMEAQMEG